MKSSAVRNGFSMRQILYTWQVCNTPYMTTAAISAKTLKKKNSNVQLSATKKRLILHQEQQQQHLFFSQNIRQCI